MIHITNLQRRFSFDSELLSHFTQRLLKAYRKKGELSIVFMNDRRIHEYNRDFLAHDYPTDVLSFPMEDEQDPLIGEILISTETAAKEAKERRIPLDEEVIRYVVHGCLHLFGFEDHEEEERKKMFKVQEQWVKRFFE